MEKERKNKKRMARSREEDVREIGKRSKKKKKKRTNEQRGGKVWRREGNQKSEAEEREEFPFTLLIGL